jgi:hypothetical protein
MKETYRFDLVFSYWIFLWWIIYIIGFTTYSPKLALIIGSIDNIILVLLMIINGITPFYLIMAFIAINICLKAIPLWIVWSDKIDLYNDIYRLFSLFLIYLCYAYLFASKEYWSKIQNIVIIGKPTPETTPGLAYIMYIIHKYQKSK